MKYLRMSLMLCGLAVASACVNVGPDTDPGGPLATNPDGSPVVGESRGE